MKDFILNQIQRKIVKKIDFLSRENFYLAGGTALALQLGHRTSKDFDFYSKKEFDPKKLYLKFRKTFSEDISRPTSLKNTLQFKIGSTDLSFFRYPYPLIRPSVRWRSLLIASPEDIAAMKLEAIIGRGKKRDFVDIYYLIKKFGLTKVLNFTKKKYPYTFNQYICLRALIYFTDAEEKDQGRARINLYDPQVSWQSIKKYLVGEVKQIKFS